MSLCRKRRLIAPFWIGRKLGSTVSSSWWSLFYEEVTEVWARKEGGDLSSVDTAARPTGLRSSEFLLSQSGFYSLNRTAGFRRAPRAVYRLAEASLGWIYWPEKIQTEKDRIYHI